MLTATIVRSSTADTDGRVVDDNLIRKRRLASRNFLSFVRLLRTGKRLRWLSWTDALLGWAEQTSERRGQNDSEDAAADHKDSNVRHLGLPCLMEMGGSVGVSCLGNPTCSVESKTTAAVFAVHYDMELALTFDV